MKYDVTCSIVTYKTSKEELKKVLKSFFSTKLKVFLYISDNSPTEELKEFFAGFDNSRIKYVYNDSNNGFGYGHNKVIEEAFDQSDYHLILNSDVFFKEGVLEELLSYMKKNEEVGTVMPMVKYPNGDIQYLCKENPNPLDIFIRRFNFSKKLKRKIDYNFEMRKTGYNKIMEVPNISGCFMLCNNKIWEKIGYFDERFFMYFEDLDLCRRIIKSGYKVVFYPLVEIVHEHRREAHHSLKMTIAGLKSTIKYFNKWGWFLK